MAWKINGNAAVAARQGGHKGHPVGASAKEAMQEQHHLLPCASCLSAALWGPLPSSCDLMGWEEQCLSVVWCCHFPLIAVSMA